MVYGRSILGLVLRCCNVSSTFAALVVCVMLSANAFGQFEKSTISGVITDATGAVVAGANVTITNVGTSAARSATTSDHGFYSIVDLAPSTYDVKVTSKGFADSIKRVAVAPGVQTTVDLSLIHI